MIGSIIAVGVANRFVQSRSGTSGVDRAKGADIGETLGISPGTGFCALHGCWWTLKGMGLIMLILIGTVPTAYGLNHAVTKQRSDDFIAVSQQAANTLNNPPNAEWAMLTKT